MRLEQTLISASDAPQLKAFVRARSHAALLIGRSFANESAIAGWLSQQLYDNETHAQPKVITFDAPSVEDVRSIAQHTHNKSEPGVIETIVVITHLEQSKHEAQNALLKQLEEPAGGVVFIVSALDAAAVLPTIQSRCSVFLLSTPTLKEFQEFFADEYGADKIAGAYMASGGNIVSFLAFMGDADHIVQDAKHILASSVYQRLSFTASYEKDRQKAISLVAYLGNILRYLVFNSPEPTVSNNLNRLELCMETQNGLRQNGNVKLLLDRLFTSL